MGKKKSGHIVAEKQWAESGKNSSLNVAEKTVD